MMDERHCIAEGERYENYKKYYELTKKGIEIWLPVEGYGEHFNKYYRISNFGRVQRLEFTSVDKYGKARKVSERLHSLGVRATGRYPLCNLISEQHEKICLDVHAIIMKSFGPLRREDKQFINHIDENKSNPRLDNLEFVSPKENNTHGTAIARRVAFQSTPCACYNTKTGEHVRSFQSINDATRWINDQRGTHRMMCIPNWVLDTNIVRYGYIWKRLPKERNLIKKELDKKNFAELITGFKYLKECSKVCSKTVDKICDLLGVDLSAPIEVPQTA